MPKPTPETNTQAQTALPALPPKRGRRRTTRASHAWRFRKPPSRKRVEVTSARSQPQAILVRRIVHLTEAEH